MLLFITLCTQGQGVIDFMMNATVSKKLNLWGDGNSLTAGASAPYPYPTLLFNRFTDISDKYLSNTGVGGQTSTQMLSDFASTANNNYRFGYNNVCIIEIGTNDIFGGVDSTIYVANSMSAVRLAKAAHYTTMINTIIPFATLGHTQAESDTWYMHTLTSNKTIRDSASTVGYIVNDLANDAAYNHESAVYNTTYYNADQVHQTAFGYDNFAKIIYANRSKMNIK